MAIFLCLLLLGVSWPGFAFEEVPPAESLPYFPGAYYRKAASSFDAWTGIRGVVTLPEGTVDLRRWGERGPLDKFSVYMGGRSGSQEVDAGMYWDITRDQFGHVDYSTYAWRPFWRIEHNWEYAPAVEEYYWYPNDVVQITVEVIGPRRMRLTVEDVGDAPKKSYSVEFPASMWGVGLPQQFKRVNAIDQSGNEGRPVQPTRARVEGAIWHEVWLMRGDTLVPFIPARFTDMRAPEAQHFRVETLNEQGGERVDIFGAGLPQ